MGFRTGNAANDSIWTAAQWNEVLRTMGRDVMNVIARLVLGDSDPATGGYVIGGLVASAGAGITSSVTKGAAIYLDATIYTSTLNGNETSSPFGLVQTESTTTGLTHADNTSGSTRYDLVVAASVLGTDNTQSVLQKGGATSNLDLRWGHETTLSIVTGTPGAGVPATPSGKIKLAEVEIPNGTTGANFGAVAVYTDTRAFVAGPYRRQVQPIYFRSTGTTDSQPFVSFTEGNGNTSLPLVWNLDHQWPAAFRPSPAATGETAGLTYFMGIPNGRTYWRSFPASHGFTPSGDAPNLTHSSADAGTTAFAVVHQDGVADDFAIYVPVPCADVRNLEIVGAQVDYHVTSALGGTGTMTARLQHFDRSAEAESTISDVESLTVTGASGWYTTTLDLTDSPIIAVGDALVFWIDVDFDGVADGAAVQIYSVSVQFKEGRT